jgi:hypothetical protein
VPGPEIVVLGIPRRTWSTLGLPNRRDMRLPDLLCWRSCLQKELRILLQRHLDYEKKVALRVSASPDLLNLPSRQPQRPIKFIQ